MPLLIRGSRSCSTSNSVQGFRSNNTALRYHCMSGWLSAHYPMKALSQTHQLRVILCALLVLTVQSQDVVECGIRHVLHTHPLTVYQLAGQDVSIAPHMDANGSALEWYVRPRAGTVKKELLKYLMVARSYSLSVSNMSDYCQQTKYHYKWYSDSTKKVEVFESARATLLIGAVPHILAGNGFHGSFITTEGSDLLRVCLHVLGAPEPVTTLYRTSSNGHAAVRQESYRFVKGCLEFTHLSLRDTGYYSFEGTNCFGSGRILFNISVRPRPTTEATEAAARSPHLSRRQPSSPSSATVVKPKVNLRLEELSGHQYVDVETRLIQAVMGNDLVLPYMIEGSPKPEMAWYKDGHRLQSNPILEFSDKDLTMRRVIAADEGFYQITVRNEAGEDRSDFQLQVVMEAGEATSFPVVSTMATKRMTDTTTGVELTDSWKEPLNRDPSVTGEDEETEDYDELTWWIVLLIGIGCVSLTISLVLWIVCCGIQQRDTSRCICGSSHVHHNHNVPCQNQRWLPPAPGEIPVPKAVNNMLMAARVDRARDRPMSPMAPPPPADQHQVQYEIPLPLSEQEERKVAQLLAASPVREKRPKVPSRSELGEMEPPKKSKKHKQEHDQERSAPQMRTLTWPPRSSTDGSGYVNIPSPQAP